MAEEHQKDKIPLIALSSVAIVAIVAIFFGFMGFNNLKLAPETEIVGQPTSALTSDCLQKEGLILRADAYLSRNCLCYNCPQRRGYNAVECQRQDSVFYGTLPQYYSQCDVSCNPNQIIGDANNDNRVTRIDSILINYINLKVRTGELSQPDNICCFDVTQDNGLSALDATRAAQIALGRIKSPGRCPATEVATAPQVTCNVGQRFGDVNDDGIVNARDGDLILNMVVGNIPRPENILCCADFTMNNELSSLDAQRAQRIGAGWSDAPHRRCGDPLPQITCKTGQRIGDADGDDRVLDFDADLIREITRGSLEEPSNSCCIDVDRNGLLNAQDSSRILNARNSSGASDPNFGVCS